MAKGWHIESRDNGMTIWSVRRTIDDRLFIMGEDTFHGPIKLFYVKVSGEMMVVFEEGDAICEIEINQIKDPLPAQDPCDESHIDVWARTQAIAFAKWTCEGLWSCYGDDWYPYRNEDNPITGEQLYDEFLKSQTENK